MNDYQDVDKMAAANHLALVNGVAVIQTQSILFNQISFKFNISISSIKLLFKFEYGFVQ